jgi:hypothetical protein
MIHAGTAVQEHESGATAHPSPVGSELDSIDIHEESDSVAYRDSHPNPLTLSLAGTHRGSG